jgi:hypothetical protein
MNGYSQLLVIEKTGAYIEYFYEHGMIEITNPNELEQGMPVRYRRLQGEHTALEELERKVGAYAGTHVHT